MSRTVEEDLASAMLLIQSGLNVGFYSPVAAALAVNVMQAMRELKARKMVLALDDMDGRVLADKSGRPIIGPLMPLLHSGVGYSVGPKDISSSYIDALQKLHYSGLLLNDYRVGILQSDDAVQYHFSARPDIIPGLHWSELTPITYHFLPYGVDFVSKMMRRYLVKTLKMEEETVGLLCL